MIRDVDNVDDDVDDDVVDDDVDDDDVDDDVDDVDDVDDDDDDDDDDVDDVDDDVRQPIFSSGNESGRVLPSSSTLRTRVLCSTTIHLCISTPMRKGGACTL